MITLLCVKKHRDKNSLIIGYTVKDTSTQQYTMVFADRLKSMIANKQVAILNLQLTSDNRLIDKNIYENNKLNTMQNIEREHKPKSVENITTTAQLLKKYEVANNIENKHKLQYINSKLNSPRFGKKIAKALLIGLTCLSVSSTLTACGTPQVQAQTNSAIEVTVDKASIEDIIAKIDGASTIDIDYKHLQLGTKMEISIDDEDIGTLRGKYIKFFDTIEFTDTNDNIINKGEQQVKLFIDRWCINDSAGNLIYSIKQNFTLVLKEYQIYDSNDNMVGKLKKNFSLTNDSAKIYDNNDNIIAEIVQSTFKDDYSIEFKEGCTLDKKAVVTISSSYMATIKSEHASNTNTSSNNK